MIRTVTNDLLLPDSTPCRALLGVHDLLVAESLPPPPAPASTGPSHPDYTETITLDNLSDVRAQPFRYMQNRLDSVDGAIRELETAVTELKGCPPLSQQDDGLVWVVEAGSAKTGRNLQGLLKLQSRFQGRLIIFTGCVPEEAEKRTWEQVRDDLLLRLGFGLPVPTGGEGEPSKVMCGCAFIGLVELLPDPAAWDLAVLKGIAAASQDTGAPLFVTLQDAWGVEPLLEGPTSALVEALLGVGAPAGRLCLCRLPCSLQYVEAYETLLAQGVILSFSFHGGIFYGGTTDLRCHPTDEEGASLVAALCRKGYASQIMVSQGICCKIQQRRFGGHGFAHIVKNVVPRLRRLNVEDAMISSMLGGTWKSMVSFASAPAPVERAVEMGQCSMCAKAFELREGYYYTKFSFVYCGTKCLRQHAQLDWKPL